MTKIVFVIALLASAYAKGEHFVIGNGDKYVFNPAETRAVCYFGEFDGDLSVSVQNGGFFRLSMELNDVDVSKLEWKTEFIPWRSKLNFTVYNGGPVWKNDSSSCLPIEFTRMDETLHFEFSCRGLRYQDGVNRPISNGTLSGNLSCKLKIFE